MNIHGERPVYYVSARPEAYEYWGEVDKDNAHDMAKLIIDHAGKHFPRIEFRADEEWHVHPLGMEPVAVYIDDHLQSWANKAAQRKQSCRKPDKHS